MEHRPKIIPDTLIVLDIIVSTILIYLAVRWLKGNWGEGSWVVLPIDVIIIAIDGLLLAKWLGKKDDR